MGKVSTATACIQKLKTKIYQKATQNKMCKQQKRTTRRKNKQKAFVIFFYHLQSWICNFVYCSTGFFCVLDQHYRFFVWKVFFCGSLPFLISFWFYSHSSVKIFFAIISNSERKVTEILPINQNNSAKHLRSTICRWLITVFCESNLVTTHKIHRNGETCTVTVVQTTHNNFEWTLLRS